MGRLWEQDSKRSPLSSKYYGRSTNSIFLFIAQILRKPLQILRFGDARPTASQNCRPQRHLHIQSYVGTKPSDSSVNISAASQSSREN